MTAKYVTINGKIRHAHAPIGVKKLGDDVAVERIQLIDRDGFSLMDNPDPQGVVYDVTCCLCGYAVCSCPPAPPKDVLPDGWRFARHTLDGFGPRYEHVSGAGVEQRPSHDGWAWFPPGEHFCAMRDWKATRAQAMAAALASAEPEYDWVYGCVNLQSSSSRECAESGHRHCLKGVGAL